MFLVAGCCTITGRLGAGGATGTGAGTGDAGADGACTCPDGVPVVLAGVVDTPPICHVATRAATATSAAPAAPPNRTPGFRYHGGGATGGAATGCWA
jgi:hypothetical protein